MKKHMKRLLSMALVCVMVLGLCGQAFAADTKTDYEGHWAEATIQAMVDLGYVRGDSEGIVRPDDNITRAEMIALINRIAGYSETSAKVNDYTDVSSDAWYYNDISIAVTAGYVTGTSETTMSPEKNILRQEAMTMLARILKLDESDTAVLAKFADNAQIDTYAQGSVAGLVTAGYVNGDTDAAGNAVVRPKDNITRAEAFTMLYKMLSVLKDIGKVNVTTWNEVYANLGASGEYDAVTSATGFTSYHAKDIPTIVHRVTDADGNTTALNGVVLTETTDAIPVSASSSSYGTCRYGDGEFVINVTSEDENYVWNNYIANLYAVTVSDGTTTVGALPWTDFYGEQAESGFHYQKVEIALNNGTSVGSNAAEITRYAAFYNEDGTVKAGTYTVTLYSEGFTPITQEITVLPTWTGKVTAADALMADTSITVTGLPEDIADATATLTYGAGRNAVTVASDVTVENGVISGLDLTAVPEGTTLNVAISSSNYLAISTSLTVTEKPVYYVAKNVSFADFYAALNDDGDVDAVSSATAQKAASCKNVYFAETPAIADGTTIEGVVVPVKVSEVAEGETALTEKPAFYLEKTESGYTYVAAATSVVDNVEASISSNGVWGNYIVMLESDLGQGTYTTTDRQTGEEKETTINGVLSANVYGAYITTTDGKQYALKQSENLWTPNDYYEFGIFTVAGSTDRHGAAQPTAYYASIEGKSIASLTYLTTSGIITANFASPLYCAPQYTGEITAELTSETTVAVSGIPADAADVTVSVGTSGRGATYLVQNAAVVDGVVTLDTAPTAGTTYTVTVSTSNYASMSTTITVPEASVSGTFTGTATVVDVDGDFDNYEITAVVTVENDAITAVEVSGYGEDNATYCEYAMNGRTRKGVEYASVPSQLIGKTVSEVTALAGIDAVSGATCSSSAIFAAVQNALANA